MPVYEYKCDCSEDIIEIQRSILDPEVIPDCPKCDSAMKKVYRTFGIDLKVLVGTLKEANNIGD